MRYNSTPIRIAKIKKTLSIPSADDYAGNNQMTPPVSLVGMSQGTASLENSSTVSYKHTHNIHPISHPSGYLFKRNEHVCSRKNHYANVYRRFTVITPTWT